jgi:hypothetical protein
MKIFQDKTCYPQTHNEVRNACLQALAKFSCSILELKDDYFRVGFGVFPRFFGHIAEIRFTGLSEKETDIAISVKTGLLLPFGWSRRVSGKISGGIAKALNYREWQKKIYSQSKG